MERLSALAAGRGWLVLAGRAAEFERELPFGVLVDALDDHLASLDHRRLERAGGERLAELAAIFPSLDGPAVPDGALQAERYRAHRAVQELLDGLALGRPLLLVARRPALGRPGLARGRRVAAAAPARRAGAARVRVPPGAGARRSSSRRSRWPSATAAPSGSTSGR